MGSIGQIAGGIIGGIAGFFIGGPAGAVTGFSFGYTIGGLVFGINLPNGTKPTNEFSITGATEGTSPDLVFGKRAVDGNIIFFGEVQTEEITEGGKGGGGGAVTAVHPFAPIHLTLALGTLRAFHGVKDGKGRDWEALNLEVGGSALQLSTGLGTNFLYAPYSAPLRGITTAFSPKWFMGENATSMTPVRFIIDITPEATLGDPYAGMSTGCNAASILWTVLTNEQWGRGLSPSTLNLLQWIEAYEIYKNEDRGLNFREPSGTPGALKSIVEKILFHTDSILRVGFDGTLELFPLRNNYVAVPLADVDMRDVQATTQTWLDVKNDLKATFPEEAKDYDQGEVNDKNDACIQMTGFTNTAQYDFPYFTDRRNSVRRLAELKDEVSFPTMILGTHTSKRYHKMRVGDVFSITHRDYKLAAVDFRIFEVADSDFGKDEMTFKMRVIRKQLIVDYVPPMPEVLTPAPILTPQDLVMLGGASEHWGSRRSPPPIGGGNGYGGGDVPPTLLGGPFEVDSPNWISPPTLDADYWGRPLFLWGARGSGRDVGCLFETVVAGSASLPVAVQGRSFNNRWAYAFVTAQRIERGDSRYALDTFGLLLTFLGYPNQAPQFPNNGTADANGFLPDMETGRWALLVGNTELWEFKSLTSLGGANYRLNNASRCVNKEYLYGWPSGTPAMLVDTRAPLFQDHMTWLAWAHRQRYVDIAKYDSALAARIRTFAQAVDLAGVVQAIDDGIGGPTGKTWLKRQGSAKADACGFYRPANEALADRGPFPSCQAFKVGGDSEYRKWYADLSGLAPGDMVVEFPPFLDDEKGIGDRVAYDDIETPGQPFGPPVSGFENVPKLPTDEAFDNFVGMGKPVVGQTYRLFVTLNANIDPFVSAIRAYDILFDGTETVWPWFVYPEAEQVSDATIGSVDVAYWVAVKGRNDAWCRPRLVQKLGPYPPQVDPVLLSEPV